MRREMLGTHLHLTHEEVGAYISGTMGKAGDLWISPKASLTTGWTFKLADWTLLWALSLGPPRIPESFALHVAKLALWKR